MTLDNDLLTLWLRAGDLTREEVRVLIDELQDLRGVEARADREADARVSAALEEADQRICELEDRIADLEAVTP